MYDELQSFRDYLCDIVGLTDDTENYYIHYLKKFLIYAASNHLPVDSVSEKQFETYITDNRLSDNSAGKTYTAAKHFCNYLIALGAISINPFLNFSRCPQPEKIHYPYTPEDIKSLLAIPNRDTLLGLRNYTIIRLLYDTGLRSNELCQLCLTDIDLDHQFLRVTGKGNKERLVPLHDSAVTSIRRYLIYRPEMLKDRCVPFLFCTTHGNPHSNYTLWCIVKKCAEAAGLGKEFTTHTLRHAFASHMLDNGADLRVIQSLLGHDNISATETYTHIHDEKLKKLHRQYHPRAKVLNPKQ